MVAYDRLSSKIWYSGVGFEGSTDVNREEIGFLDYQVCQWYKNIPESMKLSVDSPGNDNSGNRGLQRLRVLLYLRMNHLRILIYRPVLHSASSIVGNQGHARTVVDIARDTIRILARLNQTSDIYRTQQITFNWFLVAALAVLFLAVCHAPGEFSREVRDEFYLALDLINGFAGHPMENMSVYGPTVGTISELGNSPMNGLQISHELTNLFEAVGATNSFGADNLNGFISNDGDLQNSGEGLAGVLSSDAEFSRILSGLI